MNENTIEYLTKLDEQVTKNHPELAYEGALPSDADEMDFVHISMKGVRVA